MKKYNLKIDEKKFKKGISLIILILVIAVMLIISSAIIISIYNTNPIEEGKKARYEYDRDNMQTAFTDVVSKIMALNGSTLIIEPGEINTEKSGVKETVGEVEYKLKYTQYTKNSKGKIIFDKKKNTNTDFYTGMMLPIYKEETTWYVDSSGNISLKVGEEMFSNISENASTNSSTNVKIIKSVEAQRNDTSIDIEVKKDDMVQITSYTYYVRAAGESTWKDFVSSENTITIDSLDKDLDYEIKVKVKSEQNEDESDVTKLEHTPSENPEDTETPENSEG